ncbi:tape measure protein [Photobacterium atrarenae]|uniref:Tape measure protein n=1 Tax=Photobacterium atrarenae TaxID=865757 RepID=A0ABY5GN85_9GAMM|nr:tape measure protein [Photobacterium atrarenae]UTV30159.1 tape measure protein [Photobacterium atrarenae]
MNNNLTFKLKFDAETKQFVGEVKGADQAVNSLGDQAVTTSRQMKTMSRQSDAMEGQLHGLRSQLLGVAAGFSAIAAAQQATDRLGAYQDIRTQITSLVGGQQQWLETEQYLMAVSDEHNKALIGMAANYARVASIEESGMITRQQTLAIFEGMSNAASTYGATNDQLGQSMFGLQQAMASQIVRAEELNQTVEPLPGLLTRMDRAAGLAAGGFRQMVNDGEVTSAFFAETLVKALATYEGAAARTAGNVNALYGDLSTAYTELVVAYEQPISDTFSPVVLSLTDSLGLLADNAEVVSTAVGVTMALAIGRGTATLINMTAAKTKATIATRAQNAELIKQTQATIASTTAEVARLEALQLSNAYIFRTTGGEKALAVARGQLAAATTQLSAAQATASITGRTLNATMAFLGGPVGVVMMAAGAIGYFAMKASEAKKPTSDLDDEVSKLSGSFTDLNEAQRKVMITQLGVAASEVRSELSRTRSEVEQLSGNLQYLDPGDRVNVRSRIQVLNEHAQELEQQLTQISAKQTAIFNDGMPDNWVDPDKPKSSSNGTGGSDEDDKAEKQLALMQRQVALFGQTSEAAKVRYDIEHGALKGINKELADKLILEAQNIDKKKAAARVEEQVQAKRKQAEDRLAQMRSQIALYGQTGEAARVRWELEHGALRGVNEELAKTLIMEAERLDRLKDDQSGQAFWQRYYDSMKLTAESTDELWRQTFDNFSTGFGNAFADAVMQSKSLEDAFTSMAAGLAHSMLAALGKIMAQRLVMWALEKTIMAGEATSQVAQVAAEGQSAAMLAGIHAFKSTAAIPVVGPAAAPGAMATALSVTMPMAASATAAASAGILGQAHDGIDRVPTSNEGTWLLKANEMVLNTDQADNFRWMVSMMEQMRNMQAAQAAGVSSAGSGKAAIYFDIINQGGESMAIAQVEQQPTEDGQKFKVWLAAARESVVDDLRNGGPISQEGESKYGWKRRGQ